MRGWWCSVSGIRLHQSGSEEATRSRTIYAGLRAQRRMKECMDISEHPTGRDLWKCQDVDCWGLEDVPAKKSCKAFGCVVSFRLEEGRPAATGLPR
jgi:hypothetical protein